MKALPWRFVTYIGLLGILAAPACAQELGFRKPAREAIMVVDGYLWVDAEDFADYGGWTLDTQFVHLMGSGYLIADGIGTPVADAATMLNVPRAGVYRVWVRSRNWMPAHSPGAFELVVNERALPHAFGVAGSDEWVWEDGGTVTLAQGSNELILHDLTGYFGRCDAIVLTTDEAYRPPDAREAIVAERARLTDLSLEPVDGGAYEVIVVGGGSAGSAAALAAARMGARTALIQNRPVLGGNCSSEAGVGLRGASSHHANARETGLPEEAGRVKAFFGYGFYGQGFQYLAERQANLTLRLNEHAYETLMEGTNRIAGVRTVDTLTGVIREYRARVFIDCTGDGWIGYFAGADYRLGREADAEFDEDLAPSAADGLTMSGCVMGRGNAVGFRAANAGAPVAYTPPAWAYQLPPRAEFGRSVPSVTGGAWWLEHPNRIDDLWGAERARDELLRITFGYWDYVKHESELSAQAATYRLSVVPLYDAKRETRRLIGDHILTQGDVETGRVFPDRISYGGWSIDVHHPEGILSGTEGPYYCDKHIPIYTIPYRCLYSTNIVNLLFAGRCCSVTHIALGTVRVQSTLATLGQAAGTAAGLCLYRNTTPRGIYRRYIGELQQTLLKHDQTIPGIVNEDARDMARGAAATASSTSTYEVFGRDDVVLTDLHPLNMDRCAVLSTVDQVAIDHVSLYLESANAADTPLVLTYSPDPPTPNVAGSLMATSTVPAGAKGWVSFSLNYPTTAPELWLRLPKTTGISWRLMESMLEGCYRAYANGTGWQKMTGQYYACYTEPALRRLTDCTPGNVVNGALRLWDGHSNLWASDPKLALPQWIELALPRTSTIDTVQFTFDTDLNTVAHTTGRPPTCVRDYEFAYDRGGEWVTLFREDGNYQRHRVHHFDAISTDKVRLTVTATNGDASARVYELRLYHENGSVLLVR